MPAHSIPLDTRVDERTLNKLRWRSRRGLLENDLFVERFFSRYEHELTLRGADALMQLMNLADNELLSLLFGKTQLEGELDTPDVHRVLERLRERPVAN